MRRKSNYPTIKEFTPGHFMKSIFISVSSKFKRSDLISKSQALLILELSVITGDNNTRKEKKNYPLRNVLRIMITEQKNYEQYKVFSTF